MAEKFGTLDSSDKTLDIIGDRWWPQTSKQEGDNTCKKVSIQYMEKRNERPNVGGLLIGSRNCTPSRNGCVVNV